MKEIKVPSLGESIVEAIVSKWLKQEGDTIEVNEPIVELETDKVNLEVASEHAGVLESIVKAEGATVAIGDLLARVGDGVAEPVANQGKKAQQAVGYVPMQESESTPAPSTPDPEPAPADSETESDPMATPVALKVAAENNVDIRSVSGSGPGGRVTKEDVVSYLQRNAPATQPPATAPAAQQPAAPAPAPKSTPAPAPQPAPAPTRQPAAPAPPVTPLSLVGGERREERVRMTRRRQTIALRLVEAQQTAAILTTFNEIDMSGVMNLRQRRKEQFKERHGINLGFMSFFAKAVVGALKEFPMLNAEVQGNEIVLKHYYDIGIAVGVEEGLVVPVLRDADRKTFAQIEREIGELARRARDNQLTLAELQGGTFSITNGGIYGSLMSTPILNAPQVGILGMHKIEERPVAVNGEVVIRPMMYVALSYDHRIVDGSTSVRFLVRVKELVEDPEALLLEG